MDHHIQSIVFNKDEWDLDKAEAWLKKHKHTTNYKGKGVDETSQSYRFRQAEPLSKHKKYMGYYYETMHPKKYKGISIIIIHHPKKKMQEYDEYEREHKKERRDRFPSSNPGPMTEDEMIRERSYGMFNMPIELRSTIGHISEDPNYSLTPHALKHPTHETYKHFKSYFGELEM